MQWNVGQCTCEICKKSSLTDIRAHCYCAYFMRKNSCRNVTVSHLTGYTRAWHPVRWLRLYLLSWILGDLHFSFSRSSPLPILIKSRKNVSVTNICHFLISRVVRKWTGKADAYSFSKPIILHQGTTSALKFYFRYTQLCWVSTFTWCTFHWCSYFFQADSCKLNSSNNWIL